MTTSKQPRHNTKDTTQPPLKRSREVLDGNNQPSALKTEPAGEVTSLASKEFGGPEGPEPTRYGDWEKKGRCIDF